MARPATSRLKHNPPLGRMPVLQFMAPAELQIDPAYQRSILGVDSQTLIRKIAAHWNWDLCLPLVVSRRQGADGAESMFVIDGQHRLEAAKLRGDLGQLPCMVKNYATPADEAASFVHLNQQRRPLNALDLFKAAVASKDPETLAVAAAMAEAGLTLAPHSNPTAWKPGMVANIGGIMAAWRKHGEIATLRAMTALATAFPKEVLQYAGTLFPGIVAICVPGAKVPFGSTQLVKMLASQGQKDWRGHILRARAHNLELNFTRAAETVFAEAWREWRGVPAAAAAPQSLPINFVAGADGTSWCEQCEMRITRPQALGCKSRFCSFRKAS